MPAFLPLRWAATPVPLRTLPVLLGMHAGQPQSSKRTNHKYRIRVGWKTSTCSAWFGGGACRPAILSLAELRGGRAEPKTALPARSALLFSGRILVFRQRFRLVPAIFPRACARPAALPDIDTQTRFSAGGQQ